MIISRVVFILILLSQFSLASATKYYVSSSTGDDGTGRDGKSEATAWKTISKINLRTFLPGDSILFKKGDTWRETLEVPSSGTPTAYIYFGSYGTGDNPRIIGSKLATTWTSQGGNIWKSDITFTNPRTYSADIHFIEPGGIKWSNYKANTASLVAKYDWTWSSNYVYVYSSTDPATAFSSIEVPQKFSCIDTYHRENIHFNGIDVIYPAYIGYDDFNSHGDHKAISGLIIENCEISYVGGTTGTQAGFGVAVVYSDLVIRNCKIHDCGRRGISLDIYGSGFTASNAVIENNNIYGGFHTTGVDLSVGSSGYTGSWDSVYIRNNSFEDSAIPPYIYASNQIFLQNWAWSTQSAKAENIYIYNNLFKYPNGSAINMEGMNKIYVYNNVFYEASVLGSYVIQLWIDANNKNIKAKNNIFYSSSTNKNFGTSVYCVTSAANVDLDYNLYYRVNNSMNVISANGVVYYMNTIASSLRTNTGWETHCPSPANPLFMSLADFHVQGGSPAIGAGLLISEIVKDRENINFTDPPNIGCYATPKVTAVPTYLGAVIENSAPSLLEMRYNISLANAIPPSSAFSVTVNSVNRTVSLVAIAGAKVQLTLSSPVTFGDVVTVSYTRPASNQIQSSAGDMAESLTAQLVTNNVGPANPVYVSSAIENTSPTFLEMTYNLTLANIPPDVSAFTVMINSVKRNVNTVVISGVKVRLTLSSAVVYGDVVTISYTQPPVNPLQTSTGGKAETIISKSVTNNVSPPSPVYVISVIENASPSLLAISFSLSLTNSIPAVSAFSVTVNSASRIVNSVDVSGSIVKLTLASPVAFNDIVTLSYTKPAINPLQTSSGGQVESFIGKSVTNNFGVANSPPVINVTIADSYISGFVNSIDASGSTDLNNDILSFEWTGPAGVDISSSNTSKVQFLAPIFNINESLEFVLNVSDGKSVETKNISVGIWPYKPDLVQAVVTDIKASSYLGTDMPANILDGNSQTFWTSNGDYQWLTLKLGKAFLVDHFKISFSDETIGKYFFDILASSDSLVWDPLLTNVESCGFSNDLQVFNLVTSAPKAYSFIKLIGHGNSQSSLNKISEIQVFGRSAYSGSDLNNIEIKVYPNPAHDIINVFFVTTPIGSQIIRVFDMMGKLEYETTFETGLNYLQIPVTLNPGFYIIQLFSNERITGAAKLLIQ